MRSTRCFRSFAALAVAVAVAGCGSTVSGTGSATSVSGSTGSSAGLTTADALTAPSVPVNGQSAAVSAGGIQQLAGGGSSTTNQSGSAPVVAQNGPISIGFETSDINTYAKTLGIENASSGDTKAQVSAIVDYINHRGGLAGHQIKVVYYEASTAEQLNDPSAVDEAACAAWTQDAHVAAVVDGGQDDDLLSCLAKSGTPLIDAGSQWGLDGIPDYRATYAKYPNFFNVAAMFGETYDRISIARLVARHFFSSWDTFNGGPGTAPMKLGLETYDDGTGRAAEMIRSVSANLARYGIRLTDTFLVSGDLAQRESQQQSAVLRFRADGITHVMGNVGLPFFETAKSQHYYPRYFVPIALEVLASSAPADELNGSFGESFVPAFDVAQDPGPPTVATTLCEKIMKSAGQDPAWGTTLEAMEAECDGFFFLQAALRADGGLLTAPDLQRGFNALGSTVPSAETWTTFFGPNQHASAQVLRDLEFRDSCTCYIYTSTQNYS